MLEIYLTFLLQHQLLEASTQKVVRNLLILFAQKLFSKKKAIPYKRLKGTIK
jgi:hypothetical protein